MKVTFQLVYDCLSEAASAGRVCPLNKQISDATGLANHTVANAVYHLKQNRIIKIITPFPKRVIEINATGKRTAEIPEYQKPKMTRDRPCDFTKKTKKYQPKETPIGEKRPPKRRKEPMKRSVSVARSYLQYRLPILCSQGVYGGDPHLWCVGRKNRLMTDGELVDYARQMGAGI